MKKRRQFSPEYKAKAALEVLKGQRTLNEIAGDLEIHPIQLGTWKKTAVEGLHTVFAGPRAISVACQALTFKRRIYRGLSRPDSDGAWPAAA